MPYVYERNIPTSRGGTCLLIIDPQNDFHPGGSLGIPSADRDASRIAHMIETHLDQINEIYVTLDTHMKYHIAHGNFWVNIDGQHPSPFTNITLEDIEKGLWRPARKEDGLDQWVRKYVGALESQGRFTLTIWPEHCLIGSEGHAVRKIIREALEKWETYKNSCVQYVFKGNNSYTEHYSAIRAEVIRDSDKNTCLNEALVKQLQLHDKVLVCGQAKSHCVNFTVRDLVENWDSNKLDKLVLLEDGMSPVTGFEDAGDQFIKDMDEKGLTISKTSQALSIYNASQLRDTRRV
eukprot:CAMPEP_0171489480 /NCGR_PEP_ID=MMETSP0958-20121227/2779_1 /TAXON_ID=87120 /ORGANISM="Aurantiochytrium limacinum, Strain ATCCMYA-1381" /LENGTH=291 /DNA_ID=CAMNT_0012022695 /DNA_START=378 /DNA_END=1253 /DNA_ORIENTATION=-